MKFRKEDKKAVVGYIIVTTILCLAFIATQWLIQDKAFDGYRSLLQSITMITYGIAGFFAFVVGGFFFYLRFCTDEQGTPLDDHYLEEY